MQTCLQRIATALVLLVASAGTSFAVPISYNITGPGIDFSFSIDSDVTADPGFRSNGTFQFDVSASGDFDSVSFFTIAEEGGFTAESTTGPTASFDVLGPQLFIGTVDAPTLLTGVFAGVVGNTGETVTITVSNASTVIPLPATLPLLLAGIGGVALIRRRPTTQQ